MKRGLLFFLLVVLGGGVGVNPAVAQNVKAKGVKPGVIEATPLNRAGTYCHLKFPAIEPNTLGTDHPKLKSKDSGDIVDFYGPCSYDPVGADEVCRQQAERMHRTMCD